MKLYQLPDISNDWNTKLTSSCGMAEEEVWKSEENGRLSKQENLPTTMWLNVKKEKHVNNKNWKIN